MNHVMKQMHHCVAMIVQLANMFNPAQSTQLHKILQAVQGEIKVLIPKNTSLRRVATMYLEINNLAKVDRNLLVNTYSQDLLDDLRRVINDMMASGNDYAVEIHTMIESIDV